MRCVAEHCGAVRCGAARRNASRAPSHGNATQHMASGEKEAPVLLF